MISFIINAGAYGVNSVCRNDFVHKLYIKKYNIFQKNIAFPHPFVYNPKCCDMIAKKREVAAAMAGFPWSECQVRKLATSHCTFRISAVHTVEIWCVVNRTHTGSCTVTACRTEY